MTHESYSWARNCDAVLILQYSVKSGQLFEYVDKILWCDYSIKRKPLDQNVSVLSFPHAHLKVTLSFGSVDKILQYRSFT